jgi:hypothetical protein
LGPVLGTGKESRTAAALVFELCKTIAATISIIYMLHLYVFIKNQI